MFVVQGFFHLLQGLFGRTMFLSLYRSCSRSCRFGFSVRALFRRFFRFRSRGSRLLFSRSRFGSPGSGRFCRFLLRCARRIRPDRRLHRFHDPGLFHGLFLRRLHRPCRLRFLFVGWMAIPHRFHFLQGCHLIEGLRFRSGRFGSPLRRLCPLGFRVRGASGFHGVQRLPQNDGIRTYRRFRSRCGLVHLLQDLARFAPGAVGLHQAIAVQAQIVPVIPQKTADEHITGDLVEVPVFQVFQIGFPDSGMFGNLLQGQLLFLPVLP